ncbi:hypothetical protein OH76DRAFT_237544 [Lentinus brumalis]|uniref:Secreted protein n=1 Tax=Lentinus brumalis TaxID=2498619 RepID=A0A371DHJ6_9APHY|nr:hypothetical protein OH76DRAFT_237544 [Polyporus brumalis]
MSVLLVLTMLSMSVVPRERCLRQHPRRTIGTRYTHLICMYWSIHPAASSPHSSWFGSKERGDTKHGTETVAGQMRRPAHTGASSPSRPCISTRTSMRRPRPSSSSDIRPLSD